MTKPLKSPLEVEQKIDKEKPSAQKPSASEEKTLEQKIQESWNKRDGEFSEVLDSEGHRVRINRY